MKKTVSWLLALLCLLTLTCGWAEKKETTLPVHAEGSIFGGSGTDSIPLTLAFDPAWLTAADNTVYHKDLAAFAALLSADVYFRTKDLDRGTPNRILVDGQDKEKYDPTVLLSTLGFADVRYIESFREGSYGTDQNDSVTMTLGYLNDGNGNDCFVIAVRGCFSSAEWNSVFDPGSDSAAYTKLTGEHPEWKDTGILKGIGIASERAMTFIRAYMAAHDDPARQNCLLVTGHSRGGSIAQILGARFEEDASLKSFTYAFNAAPVTDDKEAEAYRTVFNVFDGADFFSDCLPFGNETLYRYGRTLSPAIAANAGMRQQIAALKGTDDYRCIGTEQAQKYRELFGGLFPDRASLYEPYALTRSFGSEEEAAAERERCRSIVGAQEGLGLEAFCSVSDVEQNADGTYAFRLSCCRAAMLQSVGRILAYGQSAAEAVHFLFREEERICAIADLIMQNAADITGGHRIINTYVLTGSAEI